MSNPSPFYVIQQVCCPHCHKPIGDLVDVAGQAWLATDTIIVRNIAGVCRHCSKPFYWSASDQMLADLVRLTLEIRADHGV